MIVAGDGEEVGEHAEQVRDQNEHEQREDHREEAHALRARRVPQHRGHEFVGHFRDRLQTARHEAAIGRGQEQEAGGHATVATMNSEELVNEKSSPPTFSIGMIFLIWNWWIGSFATYTPLCRYAACRTSIVTVRLRCRPVWLPVRFPGPPPRRSAAHSARRHKSQGAEKQSCPMATCRETIDQVAHSALQRSRRR
jgi:hypothetical protein